MAARRFARSQTTRRTNYINKSANCKWSWTFSKKELASWIDKSPWIDPAHPSLTIQQQCELLGVPRSSYYYQPRPESAENLRLLRQLDQLYLKRPFFGSRKMAIELEVNRKRIQRLMRILGIEAHYRKPNSSRGSGIPEEMLKLTHSRSASFGHTSCF